MKIRMPASAFFILFHHFYTEKQVYISYFFKMNASRPVFFMVSSCTAKTSFKFHTLS